jgi:lambda repressor-like predicted transcriptional regulator
MHPEDIKAAIRKAGSSQAAIARDLNVSNMAVTHAIRGNKSTRIARAISAVTKKKLGELWPGKYPEFEFVEAAARAGLKSAQQAEADLIKTARRQLARKGSGVAA